MEKGEIPIVVCNTSPIINLSKIERLDLLEKLFTRIFVPNAVMEELLVMGGDKENSSSISALVDQNIIILNKATNHQLIKALRRNLDYGESEAIALALEINASLILIDERDARNEAELYNLKKTGFIGILIKAKSEGYISSVKKYLDNAISKGFYIDEHLYHIVLEETKEG